VRVLMIANTLPPRDLSGVGEQVLQLASGLRDAGHEVRVLGRGAEGARGPKLLFPCMIVGPTLAMLRRFRPHVVQVHESDGALGALVVTVLAGLMRPKPLLVALLQVSYLEEIRAVRKLRWKGRTLGAPGRTERTFRFTKGPLQLVLGSLTAWLADLVLAPSSQTAKEIERDYGVEGVKVLPNVTGGLSGSPNGAAKGADLGHLMDSRYLLFVGRLRIRKGVEVLLEAVRASLESNPDLRLLIVGDGEHRTALERVAGRLALGDSVRFLGRRDAEEVRALLQNARALVVPSTYEGMPLVVLEAMEAAVPLVASRVAGIPEVVVDGSTGWLVPAEDVDALERALEHVWTDAEEAETRGLAGRDRLDHHFRPQAAVRIWHTRITQSRPDLVETGLEEATSGVGGLQR